MKNLTTVCLLALLGGCGITGAAALSPETQTQLQLAERLLAGDPSTRTPADPDGALLITDKVLNDQPDLRRARVLAGQANCALASQGHSLHDSLLADAARHFERALDIDADDYQTCMQLSWVYFSLGEFKTGREVAGRAVELSRVKGMETEHGEAFLAKAKCGRRILWQRIRAEPREDGEDWSPGVIGTTQSVLLDYRAAKQFLPGKAHLGASQVYSDMGRRSDQLKELEEGIMRAPDHYPLHTEFRNLRARRNEDAQAVAFYRRLLTDEGTNAALTYYLAIAESGLADRRRRDGNRDGAQQQYLAACKNFAAAMQAKPAWQDSCKTWLAIENIALARINQTAGELDAARQFLKTAYRHTPRVLEQNAEGQPVITDSFGTYYAGTLNSIGAAVAATRTKAALRDSLDCWLEFIELHPNKLGWLYNNAAFTARDLGTAIESGAQRGDDAARRQGATEAMAIYEKSYQLYQVAVQLAPEDARIVNDCGLMLIYHLNRDHDQARAMFRRSVELGEAAIAKLPEDVDVDTRQGLEEAVGDAYQNLGKMDRDQGKTFDTYKGYLEASVKFFPYQRRQAAIWLRTKGVGRSRSRGPQSTQNTPRRTDPRRAEYAKLRAEAKQLAAAKDYDGALLLLDKVAGKMAGLAEFHHDRGLYSFYYARKAVAAGGSIGLIDGLFGDARSNLQKAVQLNGAAVEPRLHLAQSNYESGEFVNAAKISSALLSHIASIGGTSDQLLGASHKVRAMAGNQVFVDAKMNRGDNPDELQAARNSFRALETMGNIDLDLRRKWSVMERWAGNNSGALEIFSRPLATTPNDQALLAAFVEAAKAVKQSAAAVQTLTGRQDALGLWYLGMAHYNSSFEAPGTDAAAKLQESISRLSRGIDSFRKSSSKNAAYQGSCQQWIAMCQGTQGFLELAAKHHSLAQDYFLAAAKTAPERATAKVYGVNTVRAGFELLVDYHYKNNDLGAAIKTLQAAVGVIKNDPRLSNNLGLFARDHGVQTQRHGNTAEAAKLFEISHTAYRNAVRLEPNSLRQRNDLVVVILYHIKRDLDYARDTLIQCVADIPAALADAPEDESELQDLNETVGDCYENLGYYYWKFGNDEVKARQNLEKSLTFHPFKRRRGVSFLRQLDADNKK